MPTPLETPAIAGYDVKTWQIIVLAAVAIAGLALAVRFGPRAWAAFRGWPLRYQVGSVVGALAVLVVGAIIIENSLDREADKGFEGERFVEEEELKAVKRVRWPTYGYDDARTRYLPTKFVKPPFKSSIWSWHAGTLLEFSPIAVGERLYVIDKDATVISLETDTGKVDWRRDMGKLNASSPAYSAGKVFGVSLNPGQAFGIRADSGAVDWKTPLGGRSESSPVVVGKTMIVGCECGTVYGLDVREGKVRWTVDTGGAVKGGVAVDKGIAYFGNYAGEVWAVKASNGGVVWRTGTQGASLGRTGRIYSTPAVAFGRVYVGSIDSRIYSFVQKTGELAWSHSTGDWVYPGPAVADPERAGPTVFSGSKDQNLYALDAEDGHVRWQKRVGGVVLGAASVLGDVVYVGVLGPKTGTVGFDVADGSKEFEHELGEYNPVISDGRRLYLTGSSSIRAFDPKTLEDIKHEREVRKIKEHRAKERRQAERERKREQRQRQRERKQGD
jgi:outer membrane protein assembly factor BamB